MDAPREAGLQLFTGAGEKPMTKGEREDLLAKVRAGENISLQFEATTFIQRDTPNRNYVRFQTGDLPTFAKSFTGQPFLRDHASYDLESRGGTILQSKLEHNEDGSKSMRMRVEAVKLWAQEGVLDGTIDRFSIGWDPNGQERLCSIHLASWYGCSCRLGAKLEDGRTVEMLVKSPVGTEMSGVNVPAVVGTGIESISALSALDPSRLADILGQDTSPSVEELDQMKTLATMIAALGLAPTATEEDVLAAMQENAAKLKIAEQASAEKSTQLAAIEVEAKKRSDEALAIHVEKSIKALIVAGKVAPGSEDEKKLRAFAAESLKVFDYAVEAKLGAVSVTPIGARLPAAGPDPAPAAVTEAKALRLANPHVDSMLKAAGIDDATFEKHGQAAIEQFNNVHAGR